MTRKTHYVAALTIALFIGLHLFNHVVSVLGAEKHIALMNTLRYFYRNPVIEFILLGAAVALLISGGKLFWKRRKTAVSFFEKTHVWSGLYLAFFLLNHIGAVLGARFFLQLDTNFYFGVAGINTFPFCLFFIPYYSLAIISFFAHVASIHKSKMRKSIFGLSPQGQSLSILIFGVCLSVVTILGLSNFFEGIIIPEEYDLNKLLLVLFPAN